MRYDILFSPTGGTRRVAGILGSIFGEEHTELDLCDPNFSGAELAAGDVAVISIPAYAGRIPCTATARLQKVRGNGARAVLVCVFGNRAVDNTLAEMKAVAEKQGFVPVAAVAAVAEHSMERRVAAGRPDSQDEMVLRDMAAKIREKLETGDRTPVQVPGLVPDKPIGNFGGKMAPKAAENCARCGICAEKCPTQAIDRVIMAADQSKCIGCMRCIAVCPARARKMTVVLESMGGVPVSVLCANRQENVLYL